MPGNVVKLARAAHHCGASTPGVFNMSGMRSIHAERDVHRKFPRHGLGIDVYILKLPRDDGKIDDVPTLNIYEVFHAMCSHEELALRTFIGENGVDGLSQFWSAAANSPVYHGHPIFNTPELLHKTVPLLFLYDGAEVYREQEYLWFRPLPR